MAGRRLFRGFPPRLRMTLSGWRCGRVRSGRRPMRDALGSDPYLAELVDRLHAVIGELADTRWSTRGPAVVAAGARALAREQARLDAAVLTLVGDVDARADVVPRAKPKDRGGGVPAHRAGDGPAPRRPRSRHGPPHHRRAPGPGRDGRRLRRRPTMRAHLDIAVGVHHRLGPTARKKLAPVTDPDTGEVTDQPPSPRWTPPSPGTPARQRSRTGPDRGRSVADAEPAVPGRRPPPPLPAPVPMGGRIPVRQVLLRPAQALKLTAIIAALAAPRPGSAVDADGVSVDLPDDRTAPQRRLDALLDAVDHHHPCTHHLAPGNRDGATDAQGADRRTGVEDAEGGEHADRGDRGGGGGGGGESGAAGSTTPDGGPGVCDAPIDNNVSFDGRRHHWRPPERQTRSPAMQWTRKPRKQRTRKPRATTLPNHHPRRVTLPNHHPRQATPRRNSRGTTLPNSTSFPGRVISRPDPITPTRHAIRATACGLPPTPHRGHRRHLGRADDRRRALGPTTRLGPPHPTPAPQRHPPTPHRRMTDHETTWTSGGGRRQAASGRKS